jgi:hypothetical protein
VKKNWKSYPVEINYGNSGKILKYIKFSFTSFIGSCVRQKIDYFSKPQSAEPYSKAIVMPELLGKENLFACTAAPRKSWQVYKKYFYDFVQQKAALTREKCLTTLLTKLVKENLLTVHTREGKIVKENVLVRGFSLMAICI